MTGFILGGLGLGDGLDGGDGAGFGLGFGGYVGEVSCFPVVEEDFDEGSAAAGAVEGFFFVGALVLGLGG